MSAALAYTDASTTARALHVLDRTQLAAWRTSQSATVNAWIDAQGIAAGAGYAGYTLFSKFATQRYRDETSLFWSFAFATLALAFVAPAQPGGHLVVAVREDVRLDPYLLTHDSLDGKTARVDLGPDALHDRAAPVHADLALHSQPSLYGPDSPPS